MRQVDPVIVIAILTMFLVPAVLATTWMLFLDSLIRKRQARRIARELRRINSTLEGQLAHARVIYSAESTSRSEHGPANSIAVEALLLNWPESTEQQIVDALNKAN